MTPRPSLLTAALALGLLAGCSRNAPAPQPAESGGTPTAQVEAPASPPPSEEKPSGGTAPAEGRPTERGPAVFFVKDSGVRCMAAPCPTFLATRPDRPGEDALQVTDINLEALNLGEEKRNQLLEATHGEPGLKVEATVETVPNAGPAGAATVLRVTRLVEK